MHRAEKSSSKLCRSREVERAQELHRRKISGVRSYLSGIISKPSAARPPNSFRRSQASVCGTTGSSVCTDSVGTIANGDNDGGGDAECGDGKSTADSYLPGGSAESFDSYHDDDFEGDALRPAVEQPSKWFASAEGTGDGDAATAKADEFRSPVAIRKATLPQALLPPGPPPKKKSLNRAFRVRKLREIEASNVGMLDRIKKSAAHYRNDDLRRDWRQNVSYLSSICEFPLAEGMMPSPTGHASVSAHAGLRADGEDEEEDLSFLAGKHASISAATAKASASRSAGGGSCLPSIQPTPSLVHPIKAIPTSPKKAPLNLVPAFRSLRKAMPQQPALPPITSPSRGSGGASASHDVTADVHDSVSALELSTLSPRRSSTGIVLSNSRSRSRRPPAPTRQSSASIDGASVFIGDLHALEGQPEAPGELRYQVLKTGRFVGGTYLVLTVFFGDGVRNAYGFDVFAFDRELQCEYSLSVTREMAHELIESVSSSSLAAETEAAAGTNWSMQQIACSICDHVRFATLESGRGEVLFLVSSVAETKRDDAGGDGGGKAATSSVSLLVDAQPHLMALCVHRVVEFESDSDCFSNDLDGKSDGSESPPSRFSGKSLTSQQQNKKRRLHVFATSCSSTTCDAGPGLDLRPGASVETASHAAIQFLVLDQAVSTRSCYEDSAVENRLATKVSVDELYLVLGCERDPQQRRVSLERMVAAAVSHLHIISVPSGEGDPSINDHVRDALILNARVNSKLRVCESSPTSGTGSATSLQRKRSRQQLLAVGSPLFAEPSSSVVLLQTGLVWRDAYLLAQVSVVVSDAQSRMLYQPWHWRGHQVRDMDESISVRVFNPASGLVSERVLTRATVDGMLEALGREAIADGAPTPTDLDALTFSRKLLGRLQLDADLFGAQVLAFPDLERSLSLPAPEERYPSESTAAVVLQAHFRGFLCRKKGECRLVGGNIEAVAEEEEDGEEQEERSDEDSGEEEEGGRGEGRERDARPASTLRVMEHADIFMDVGERADPVADSIGGAEALDAPAAAARAPPALRKGVKTDGCFVLRLQRSLPGATAAAATTVLRIAALGALEVVGAEGVGVEVVQ